MNIKYIHQIEVTTRCNLACPYCPHPKMQREKTDMNSSTFYRVMEWVKHFTKLGQQRELAFTGIGEALLHPYLFEMLEQARQEYAGLIHFSTNGILFDDEAARFCAEYQIGVFVSMHRPERAVPAKNLAKKYNVLLGENHAFVDSALDWAGTVNWHVSAPKSVCRYQQDGWGVVLVDGSITTCCMDSEQVNKIGHVVDDIGTVDMHPMPLCKTCHLEILQ